MKRSGFTILEAMVAAVLLAVAATVCVQMFLASATARQNTDLKRLATREAANVMERVMAMPLDELTPEAVAQIELSRDAKPSLPNAKLNIRLDEPSGDGPKATRITVELFWQRHAGEPSPPIRLLAWRFRPQETQP